MTGNRRPKECYKLRPPAHLVGLRAIPVRSGRGLLPLQQPFSALSRRRNADALPAPQAKTCDTIATIGANFKTAAFRLTVPRDAARQRGDYCDCLLCCGA